MLQLRGGEEEGGDSRSGPSDIRILNIPDLTTNYTFTSIDTRSLLSSMKGGGRGESRGIKPFSRFLSPSFPSPPRYLIKIVRLDR